jgi:hypothetical protein
MNRSNKYLLFTVIFSPAIVLTGYIVAPPNKYGYKTNIMNLSLLHNFDESEADQRLSTKCFYQIRKNEPDNTKWLRKL